MSELEFLCGFCRENPIDITGGTNCCSECASARSEELVIWEDEFTDEEKKLVLSRMKDARDHPEKMLSIDEFISRCKDIGIEPTEEDHEWARGVVKKLKEREEVEDSKGSTDEV